MAAALVALLAVALDGRWAQHAAPKKGPAEAIGAYANGCLAGGKPLPSDGPGYRVVRLGRRRFFGHPALIDYVRRLGRGVRRARLGYLLVGDLSQPRGGPTPTGHRSHQTGLDVDVAYVAPPEFHRRAPRPAQRETLPMAAVVDLTTRTFTAAWRPEVLNLLALAARDQAVDRIFVHPVIKREVCTRTKDRRAAPWLAKLRPWYGHHDHFHVRLACPAGSPDCQAQDPLPPGDGCDSVDWWFTADAQATRERRAREDVPPPPHPRCEAVVAPDAPR